MSNLHLLRPNGARAEFATILKKHLYNGGIIKPNVSEWIVPAVDDLIISYNGNLLVTERVVSVDPHTDLSTLTPVYADVPNSLPLSHSGGVRLPDLGDVSVVLINPTLPIISAVIHSGLPIRGVDINFARLFLGNDMGTTGTIISLNYDTTGTLIDDKIGVVRADPTNPTDLNYVLEAFSVDRSLLEDTVCRLVIYNNAGMAIGYYTVMVAHNHALSNLADRALFISDLVIDSQYVNPAVPNELIIPAALQANDFAERVFKVYHTNQRKEIAINNKSNFHINGWDAVKSAAPGDRRPIVLTYIPIAGERAEHIDIYNGAHVAKTYSVVIAGAGVATVKSKYNALMTFPIWDSSRGYTIKTYLYSEEHDTALDVSAYTTITDEPDGKNFTDIQKFSIAVDLSKVASVGISLVVSKTLEIAYKAEPLTALESYVMYPEVGNRTRFYGAGLRMTVTDTLGSITVSMTNGYQQYSEWLDEMYFKLCPPYNPLTEANAPKPTHCDVVIDGTTVTFAVENDWRGAKPWIGSKPANGTMAVLSYYYIDTNGKKFPLAVSSMVVEVV